VVLALRDLNANAVRRFDVELDALRVRSFA
jgi:hypothetical protein